VPLPVAGTTFISVNDYDKGAVAKIARDLHHDGLSPAGDEGYHPLAGDGRPAGDAHQ
jgi:hypothetical protein